ncbi:hypothetical protein OZ410_06670, partial [Robiginitalea sp. M366]|uniref:hypothetical protein n=1 Tax=Robiginitalea aestuariiviva TaxID=3036903 RepID=UPI00240E7690
VFRPAKGRRVAVCQYVNDLGAPFAPLYTPRNKPAFPSKSGCKYRMVFLVPQKDFEKKFLKVVLKLQSADFQRYIDVLAV